MTVLAFASMYFDEGFQHTVTRTKPHFTPKREIKVSVKHGGRKKVCIKGAMKEKMKRNIWWLYFIWPDKMCIYPL